ncbi:MULTISPECIES: hypothetical protein [Porphyromonadaceae]|uniref:Uncharacterized protein n=2 Tax=Sanguibacteroides justesenii TaxID=1547597 RepID=A0AB34R0Q2_9PORP|nr:MULTISPECIES: hypothetical protein [Porphyromonadaceae]KIO43356.1 hypothetical protein IE90_09385 [Sanguibacteroides justesenii]PXZ45370.1 hypothetical protein DMB45_02850 [Sanguibacteroides justesenii]
MVYFSKWNRKGYAIFASLRKEVRIATLSIDICKVALGKSSLKGIIVDFSGVSKKIMVKDKREESDGGLKQVCEVVSSCVGAEFPVKHGNEKFNIDGYTCCEQWVYLFCI